MSVCRIESDPSDAAFDIVTMRVPKGTVPCAQTLASQLSEAKQQQDKQKLLWEMRHLSLAELQAIQAARK